MQHWQRAILLWSLGLLAGLSVQAQEKPASPEVLPVPPKPALSLSQLPFPANQIVVVTDDLRKALEQMPVRWVLLSPETYRKLLEQAERSQATETVGIGVFAECHYRGVVNPISESGNRAVLHLALRLVFVTSRPDQRVELGLKGARLTRAELDGQSVRWASSENGLALYAVQPGRHELNLEIPVNISYDSAQRQYVARLEDVPAAVITSLEVYIPGQVQTASISGAGPLELKHGEWDVTGVTARPPGRFTGTRLRSEALGTLRQLELTWQPTESAATGPTGLLEGRLEVTLRERVAETEARLTLTVHRGHAAQLRFRLPPGSTQVFWTEENKGAWNALRADNQGIISLKPPATVQAGSTPWSFLLRWQQAIPEKGPARLPVGRLELLEPAECQQTGWIEIRNPENRALSFASNAVQVEAQRFRYWFQPIQLEVRFDEASVLPPLLEAQVQYQVMGSETALMFRSEWRILRVVRGNLQELTFSWPEGFELDRRGLPAGVLVENPQVGRVRVRLVGSGPFPRNLSLEGWLPQQPAPESSPAWQSERQRHAVFALPWLVSAADDRNDQKVTFTVQVVNAAVQFPAAGSAFSELMLGPKTRGLLAPGGQRILTPLPLQLPAELRWDAYQTDQGIVLDVDFRRRLPAARWVGRLSLTRKVLRLEQTIYVQFTSPAPHILTLHLPPELHDLQRVLLRTIPEQPPKTPPREDWLRLQDLPNQDNKPPLPRYVILPPEVGRSCQIHIVYTADLANQLNQSSTLVLPVVLPDHREVDLQEGKIYCWHSKDVTVQPQNTTHWQPIATRATGEELPADLVLATSAPDAPLSLQVRPVEAQLSYAERLLVLVQPQPGQGKSLVTAKYWFTRLGSSQWTIRLPPRTSLVDLRINQQTLNPEWMSPMGGEKQLQVHLEPADLVKPALLEVTYCLETDWFSFFPISLPHLEPQVEVGRSRWAVMLESGWRPVYVQTTATPEQPWTWQVSHWAFWNWWRFPASAHSLQRLDQWLVSGQEGPSADNNHATATWYLWQQLGQCESMRVLVIGWHAWLLTCSLLSVILGAIWLYGPRWLRWTFLSAMLVLLALAASFTTWTFLAILAGAWPGMLIAAVLVLVMEFQRWWWEKRLEWLAGFAPAPPGSTVQARPAGAAPAPSRSAVQVTTGQSAPASRSKPPSTQLPASPAHQANP